MPESEATHICLSGYATARARKWEVKLGFEETDTALLHQEAALGEGEVEQTRKNE